MNMLNDPFNINEMQSLLLIIIGTLIAIISVVEGYKFSDPHIGFENVHRRMKLAEEDLRDEKEEYRSSIVNLYEDAITDIDDKFKKIEDQIVNLQEVRPEVDAFFGCIDSYYEHTSTAAHSLVSSFREGFNAVRLDDPLPYSKKIVDSNLDDINLEERRSSLLKLIDERIFEQKGLLKNSENTKKGSIDKLKKTRNNHMTDKSIDDLLIKVKESDDKGVQEMDDLVAEAEVKAKSKSKGETEG